MNVINTVHLTKYYGKTRGISDISLSVHEGDFFGFIGPNGAGKSTFIRTLLGLIQKTSGDATLFERDIEKGSHEIRRNIGYLPSEAVFYPGMKVRDVIALSASLRKIDCKGESSLLCDRLQLDTSRNVDELSYGNRKKVGIVCALQHKPRLIILDEPTSGLDPLMQHEFFDILRKRNSEGSTVFLSSHILSEIQHNCKRAAIIRDGKIITCDSVLALSKTNAKRVSIRGNFDVDMLQNVRDIKAQPESVSFLYSGDINALIASLAGSNIVDLSISEPDLEEIFMHYYTNGGENK